MAFWQVSYKDPSRPVETVTAQAMDVKEGHLMFFGLNPSTGQNTDVLSAYAPGTWITSIQVNDRGERKATDTVDAVR